MPEGFAQTVRERGAGYSTGQKQLINFARALAHNPRFLILDEATSSVDTETELRIREALQQLVVGRTSIVIAHRLSTIQRADRIIVMHKGKLREIGTHQELLAIRGIYWKLYQLQYKDQESGGPRLAEQQLAATESPISTVSPGVTVFGANSRLISIGDSSGNSLVCESRGGGSMSKLFSRNVLAVLAFVFPMAARADVTGTQPLSANSSLSLDTGTVGAGSTGDILWTGSSITFVGSAKAFDLPGGNSASTFPIFGLAEAQADAVLMTSVPIPLSSLVAGNLFVVQTNSGSFAKVLVTAQSGTSITLEFDTFGSPAPKGPTVTALVNNYS